MDLFDDWTELFEVFRRRGLVQEMDLLEVLVDVLLGVLWSARRHADLILEITVGEGSEKLRRMISPEANFLLPIGCMYINEGDDSTEHSESQSFFKMPTTTITFDAM